MRITTSGCALADRNSLHYKSASRNREVFVMALRLNFAGYEDLQIRPPHPLSWYLDPDNPVFRTATSSLASDTTADTANLIADMVVEKLLRGRQTEIIPVTPKSSKRDVTVTKKKALKLCPVCHEKPLTGKQKTCSAKCRKQKSRAAKPKARTKRAHG